MLFVSGAQFVFRFGVLNTNIKTFVCGLYFKESLSVKHLFDSCPNIKFLTAGLLSWLFLYCTFIYCHTKARFFFLSFPEAYISRPSSSTSRNLTNIFGYSIRFNTWIYLKPLRKFRVRDMCWNSRKDGLHHICSNDTKSGQRHWIWSTGLTGIQWVH